MKNYSYERVITGILAILLLLSLIIVGFVEVRRRAGRLPEPFISAESYQCYECHAERGISKISITGWRKSLHAERGIGCNECHLPAKEAGEEIIKEKTACEDKRVKRSVSFHTCKRCHKKQVEEFNKGIHSSGMKSLAYTQEVFGIRKEVLISCEGCHSIGKESKACGFCHAPHVYSAASSRKPEVCAGCHDGREKRVYSSFLSSNHGILFRSVSDVWDWELKIEKWKPLLSLPASSIPDVPLCVTCHMINGSHSVGIDGELSFKVLRLSLLVPSSRLRGIRKGVPAEEAQKLLGRRREEIKKVCTACHGKEFVDFSFNEMDMNLKRAEEEFLKNLEAFPLEKRVYDLDLLPFTEKLSFFLLYQQAVERYSHFGRENLY